MANDELHDILQALASNIEPSGAQRESASRSQRALRESLDTGIIGSRIVRDFLSGSYARHTAVAPLDDVDIVFVINPEEWRLPILRSLPKPADVLATFEGAIRRRYPDSHLRTQRRSVGLQLHHLDIDAVPAVETDTPKVLLIPDIETDDWIRTAPEKHSDLATRINEARGGLFKPLVKLLKNWNGHLGEEVRLRSFAIETLCARIFDATAFSDLYNGALRFFDFLSWCFREDTSFKWSDNFGIELGYWTFGYNIPDTAGTGSNLADGMTDDNRKRFLEAAVHSRERLLRAERARYEKTATEHLFAALGVK